MPQNPLLTKDEIKALIDSGDLTPDVAMEKLLPPERAIYEQMASASIPKAQVPFKDASRPAGPASVKGALMAGGAIGGGLLAAGGGPLAAGAKMFSEAHPYVSAGLGYAGLEQMQKLGLPAGIVNALETMLGLKTMMHQVGKPGSAPSVRESPMGTRTMPMSDEEFFSRTGRNRDQYSPRAFGGTPPNVEKVTPGFTDLVERMEKGVTNDFRGRAHIQRGEGSLTPAYSPNVNTQSSVDDILEMLTRSSSQGAPSPLRYHESAPQGMRKSVDALKRQTKRRSPSK